LSQLGQTAERLHLADDGVERLAIARGAAKRPSGAIECTRDESTFPSNEGADARVQLITLGAAGIRRTSPRQCIELQPQPGRARGIGLIPLPDSAHEQPEVVDGLSDPLARAGVPFAPALTPRSCYRLETGRRPRDVNLTGHQCGPAQQAHSP